jgi:hypothetical protein
MSNIEPATCSHGALLNPQRFCQELVRVDPGFSAPGGMNECDPSAGIPEETGGYRVKWESLSSPLRGA